ncbi:MAG: DNA repair protein RadC [Alphaproteobacteria bacterium]|nr:DNA repair protein RadC [Alphaproteobacteria bacterium]
MNNTEIKHYNFGHRKRIINKLKQNGYEQFYDYEVVELMLFLIFKRKDTKQIAKMLLSRFKTIDNILNATEEELMQIEGIGKSTCNAFKIIDSIVKSVLKSKVINKNVIECFNDVIRYIKLNMQNLYNEEVRLLLLNNKNIIIDDILIQKGSIDYVGIYPQEILKHCLNKCAKSIILIHNHPSGNPTPSSHDIYITNKIQEATSVFNITLFDHIIIGDDQYISFRNLNLINK